MELVLRIDTSGQVKSLHSDRFDLGFLGAQTIHRASDIRFSAASQKWELYLWNGEEFLTPMSDAFRGFGAYDSAREFEVLFLTESMKGDVDPFSNDGVRLAEKLRFDEV